MDLKNAKTRAWILLVVCAAIAALSGSMAFSTHSGDDRWFGSMVMIFSGLVGITGPALLVSKKTD
jgi:hypothetical protein